MRKLRDIAYGACWAVFASIVAAHDNQKRLKF